MREGIFSILSLAWVLLILNEEYEKDLRKKTMAEKSGELMRALLSKGYPEEFCKEITFKYLNTDYTAMRMIGYLNKMPVLKIEDCVDEMLAILSDRDRIMEKHRMLEAQAVMNDVYRNGLQQNKVDK